MIDDMTAPPGTNEPRSARSALPFVAACVLSAAAVSCASVSELAVRPAPPESADAETTATRYTPTQTALTERARARGGARGPGKVDGVRFNADCSGTMLAVFYAAGLDLRPGFNRVKGNTGVERLYNLMDGAGLLDDTDVPQPGSLVFWDDTYDRNGDGKKNDPLSHVGLIVSADGSGNLSYVHYHYRDGVVEERMNLREPSVAVKKSGGADVIVNSPLRMKSWKPDAASLAGELYRAGARAYEYAGDRLASAR